MHHHLLTPSLSHAGSFQAHACLHPKHLVGHRKFGGGSRWGGMVKASLAQGKAKEAPPAGGPSSVVGDLDESTVMDKQAFESLLGKIDRGLRALPATAQVRGGCPARWHLLPALLMCGMLSQPNSSTLGRAALDCCTARDTCQLT